MSTLVHLELRLDPSRIEHGQQVLVAPPVKTAFSTRLPLPF